MADRRDAAARRVTGPNAKDNLTHSQGNHNGGRPYRFRKRRDRLPSDAFAQLQRAMAHPSYREAGAPVKALVDRVLVEWADGDAKCWQSNATLAKAMNVAERNIRTQLTKAEEAGVLAFPEGRKGGWTTNLIVVVVALERMEENVLPKGGRKRPPSPDEIVHPPRPKTSAEQKEVEQKEGEQETPSSPPGDERDLYELRMAFSESTGTPIPSTPSGVRTWDRPLSELRDVGAAPEDVRAAVDTYLSRGWADPTPRALAKHWHTLRPSTPGDDSYAGMTVSADDEIPF